MLLPFLRAAFNRCVVCDILCIDGDGNYFISRYFEALEHLNCVEGKKKNAFEECQACLKYLLLLLEDAAEKTPFM